MNQRPTFSRFEPYQLTGLKVTNEELGHGSYATVLKVDYMGLKCAGKKIHEALLKQGDTSYTLCRFEEECRLLSQVHHPNIVQFLGVHFERGVHAPILVMEFLLMNLTTCINQYGILPEGISYSILHDVSLGLCYLHNHAPSIIHRDLSANNILLDSSLKAKISDLGVARILDLTPLQVSRMTQTPGTPTYMPPEVMIANPRYNKSVDMFSYGILMIHVFSGSWPEPQIGPSQVVEGKLIPVTEAERRTEFLQTIGCDHPLMDLILRCVHNDPQQRIDISNIVEQLARMVLQSPAPFPNRLDVLRHIEAVEKDKRSVEKDRDEKSKIIEQNEEQIINLKEEIQMKECEKGKEVERLSVVHKIEVEQLHSQIKDLVIESDLQKSVNSTTQRKLETKDAIISMKNDIISTKDSELEAAARAKQDKDAVISSLTENLNSVRKYLGTEKQVLQSALTWKQCANLPKDLAEGQSVVISGKVYYGGSASTMDECTVYCYDPQRDKWSTLPPLPVRYFGLGRIGEELVAIGGVNIDADEPTNKVHVYDAKLERWKEMIVATMPSARAFPSVMSVQLGLIVAGGLIELYDDEYTDVVEIFQADISQWYTTDPLPRIYSYLSTVAIDETCYILGESDGKQSALEDITHPKALYAPVDDLISNAVPANQTLQHDNNGTHSAWNMLPHTPSYQPALTALDGYVVAVGGWQTSKEGARKKDIYVFSPSMNSWVYISDLPAPRTSIAVAIMNRMEILVIGGQGGDDDRVSTVYKGCINLKL